MEGVVVLSLPTCASAGRLARLANYNSQRALVAAPRAILLWLANRTLGHWRWGRGGGDWVLGPESRLGSGLRAPGRERDCPQRPGSTLELSLTEDGTELGAASVLSLVASDRPPFPPPKHGVLGNARRLPGLDGLFGHAARASRGGGVTQRRPCGIPFRSPPARPAWPPGRAEAVDCGAHRSSPSFAPTPNWHLWKSRTPAPRRPVETTSPSPGQKPRSPLCSRFSAQSPG